MVISASSGVYDVYESSRFEILRATIKSVAIAMLMLTAVLFIFKVSDNVSRLWLGTWSFTSSLPLPRFPLLTPPPPATLRPTRHSPKTPPTPAPPHPPPHQPPRPTHT